MDEDPIIDWKLLDEPSANEDEKAVKLTLKEMLENGRNKGMSKARVMRTEGLVQNSKNIWQVTNGA